MLKKILGACLLLLVMSFVAVAQQPVGPQTHLKVGAKAPDFTLTDTEGKEVKLSDFKGKKGVVLAFYVLAFTGG
jgi:peroxiredoxin